MKIGVIISSNDAETCCNAMRYANFALGQKDEIKVFFMGKGVEYQNDRDAQNDETDQHEDQALPFRFHRARRGLRSSPCHSSSERSRARIVLSETTTSTPNTSAVSP